MASMSDSLTTNDFSPATAIADANAAESTFFNNLVDQKAAAYPPLQDILGRLPAQPGDRPGEFLPDVWFAAHPRARRKLAS
jgi:hypothetical protein